MIVFEKNGQTQQVEERETKRMEILQRLGWKRSEVKPIVVESTAADGYNVRKTDADLARIAETERQVKRRKVQPTATQGRAPDTTAQRTITGQQSTVRTGALPEDFPGYDALREAGIGTYETLRETGDIASVKGIGKAPESKIREALR